MDIIFGVLATIRLSDIIEKEKIAFPLREFFGIGHNRNKEPLTPSGLTGIKGFFGAMLWCWRCISVWVGLFFSFLYLINQKTYKLLVVGLSFSYLAFEVEKVKNKALKRYFG